MITAEDVAQWMVEEMWRRKGRLEQAIAVEGILKKFGREFLYENKKRESGYLPRSSGCV
ncbi:DUF6953 family protein [Bradyrhizobium diazoefficiens]